MIALFEAYKAGLLAPSNWRRNIFSGINVAVVALPLSMAFAIASGALPSQGILTAVVAGFIVAVFGGSRLQITGATGAFIVILSGVIGRFGMEGLQIATVMAGLMLVLLGFARMGAVIRFIPEPVTIGFTSGIAVIIWIGQWQEFFGLDAVEGEFSHERIWALLQEIPFAHEATLGIGASILLLLLLLQVLPKVRRLPGPLIALVVATAVQSYFGFEGVRTIGSAYGGLSSEFPSLSFPTVTFSRVVELLSPAFAIAMLGAISSLLSAVVVDGMSGNRHNANQEIIGQGLANIVTPILGGLAAAGGVARTATNFRNGGNSPIAGITHSIVLALVLVYMAPLATNVPLAALAAILFVVAWNMSQARRFIRLIRRAPKADVVILLMTFLLTVFADLIIAINLGVILATLNFLHRMSKSVEIRNESGSEIREEFGNDGDHEVPEGYVVYSLQGPFFFGAAEAFQRVLQTTGSEPRGVFIRLRWVPFIDVTGIESLEAVVSNFHRRDVRVVICGANEGVLASLRRAGLIDLVGESNIFDSFEHALSSGQETDAEAGPARPSKRSTNKVTRILSAISGRKDRI